MTVRITLIFLEKIGTLDALEQKVERYASPKFSPEQKYLNWRLAFAPHQMQISLLFETFVWQTKSTEELQKQ